MHVCLIIFWALLVAPYSQQSNSTQKHQQKAYRAPYSALLLVGQETPAAQKNGSENKEPDSLSNRFVNALIANWPLVVIAIPSIWFGFRTLKDIKTQTAATETAANAAKKSADLAETTMRVIEAPDLFLDKAGLVPAGPITPDSYVALGVKNFGGSRAKNVRSFIKLIIPNVPETELSTETFSLGRGGTQVIRFLTFKETLNRETFDKIVRDEISVRFSGDISYEDVFGETYILNCRGVLNPNTGTFAMGDEDPRKRK